MSFLKVIVLAIVQGLAELLPVSSSAHVVVAEKLMGLDPSAPPMTLLLVMLHTGTMFAVIVYFWQRWRATYFASMAQFKRIAVLVVLATALTGIIGEALKVLIEKTVLRGIPERADRGSVRPPRMDRPGAGSRRRADPDCRSARAPERHAARAPN